MDAPSVVTEHCSTRAETGADGRSAEDARAMAQIVYGAPREKSRGAGGGNTGEKKDTERGRKFKEALGGETGEGGGRELP